MDHRLALFAVQVRQPDNRLRPVELEDKGQVLVERSLGDRFAIFPEGNPLPVLPFVFTEIEDLEGFAACDAEQALASYVDGPSAEITADPTTAKFLGDCERGTGTTEEVGHN